MARAKGTPKTGGRAKGVVNKVTARQKASLEIVMNALEEGILEDILAVNSSRRLQLYTDLMNYIKPKLASNKNENDTNVTGGININVSFEDLTPDTNE
jgi:hypothetical protein